MTQRNTKKRALEGTLIPCPYCGEGRAVIASNKHELGTLTYFGMCMSCGAKGPTEKSAENAALEWNRRDGELFPERPEVTD